MILSLSKCPSVRLVRNTENCTIRSHVGIADSMHRLLNHHSTCMKKTRAGMTEGPLVGKTQAVTYPSSQAMIQRLGRHNTLPDLRTQKKWGRRQEINCMSQKNRKPDRFLFSGHLIIYVKG